MTLRLAPILIVLSAGIFLAGCGAGNVIDDEKTQIALKYDIQEATGEEVKSVTCPESVPASVGTRFTCRVDSQSGEIAVAELEVTSEQGDLKVLKLTAG